MSSKDVEGGKITPDVQKDTSASAADVAKRAETTAAAKALQEDEQEISLEEEIRQIAQEVISNIPEAERGIEDQRALNALISMLKESREPGGSGGVFTQSDLIGNYIVFAEDAASTAVSLRESIPKLLDGTEPFGKLDYIRNSTLPASVQNAFIELVLAKGPNAFVDTMAHIADDLAHATSLDEAADIVQRYRRSQQIKDSDTIHRQAFQIIFSEMYPQLDTSRGLGLMQDVWDLYKLQLSGAPKQLLQQETETLANQVRELSKGNTEAEKWLARIPADYSESTGNLLERALRCVMGDEVLHSK